MIKMKQGEHFTYWKRPWHKWLILIVAIMQFQSLWLNIDEYRTLAESGIFSSPAWEHYAVLQRFECALNGLLVMMFLGIFLISGLARNYKAARLAEGVLLFILALGWGIVGIVLQSTVQRESKIAWMLILIMIVAGSVVSFWKSC